MNDPSNADLRRADTLAEALRQQVEAPDPLLVARSERDARAVFLQASAQARSKTSDRDAHSFKELFGAFAVAAVVILYGGWAFVAAGGIYQ